MAKVNLLTIHWGNSYGALMQAYATCKILEEHHHEVTFIHLVSPKTKHRYKILKNYLNFSFYKDFQFYWFKKRYFSRMTRRMFSINPRCIPAADYTIVGSDQVWNPDITAPIQNAFFLDFDNGKKISLASSFGKSTFADTLSVEDRAFIRTQLQKFVAISVREDSAVRICKEQFGIAAQQLIDPTLAYGQFEHLIKGHKPINEIFCFLFNTGADTNRITQKVSAELRLPIHKDGRLLARFNGGPVRWLESIHNSEYIITDSFHGLAFSILFKKKFIVLCADKNKFTRLYSLLSLLGLTDRFVGSYDYLEQHMDILYQDIDYTQVDAVLQKEKQRYYDFVSQNVL